MTLTDDELRDCAQACRAVAKQAETDAKAQENPQVRAGFVATAMRFTELAGRFELARSSRPMQVLFERKDA
jgi:hypothetical protein